MMLFLKGFALALSMLSTLPFFKIHDFSKGINGYAVMFYPLVGFLLGSILLGSYIFLQDFFPRPHTIVILFALWILLTGALHLDGLSDTIDGLYVSKKKAFEIMKDPNVGAMGMLFSITFLILKLSSLLYLEALYLLPLIMLLSRFNAAAAIYLFPYVSQSGMASLAKEEFQLPFFLFTALYVTTLALYFSWPLLLLSLFVLFVLQSFFIKRYGGFTGDIYGFSIELTELVLLNGVIAGL